jgi:hypothetical protein
MLLGHFLSDHLACTDQSAHFLVQRQCMRMLRSVKHSGWVADLIAIDDENGIGLVCKRRKTNSNHFQGRNDELRLSKTPKRDSTPGRRRAKSRRHISRFKA